MRMIKKLSFQPGESPKYKDDLFKHQEIEFFNRLIHHLHQNCLINKQQVGIEIYLTDEYINITIEFLNLILSSIFDKDTVVFVIYHFFLCKRIQQYS